MITFACVHCGKQFQVSDKLAGKKARCSGCSQITRIQSSETVAPPALSDAATVAPEEGVSASARPPLLQNLPGYEVLGELGRGGMGVVYKARQLKPKRLVALKMVLAGELASQDALARFRTEAEAVARLQHPNIVQVHELGEHQGRPFFSLELVEGGSLADLLNEKPVGSRQAAEILLQVARGVHFAHKRGIVHRDLKPANILIAREQDEEGQTLTAKVTDFGLAKQVQEGASLAAGGAKTASGAVMGTPAYMAPEQASGKTREIGPAADVYALGAILYEMLAGQPPFEAPSMLDVLLKVATEDPVPPRQHNPKAPRDLETIALKCLRKEPASRYKNANELAEDLRRYLEGEPIKARPQSRFEKLRRSLRKHQALVYAAIGAMVAVLGVGLVFLFVAANNPTDSHADRARDESAQTPSQGGSGTADIPAQLSINNLKQLSLGMHAYHDIMGALPTAAIFHKQTGRPLLSWRVAILPYIEGANLFNQFRLDEAWDSPHNAALASKMPAVYYIPGTGAPANHTHYQVFTGRNTVFAISRPYAVGLNTRGLRIPDVRDGTSNTLMIVEATRAVPWTKPEDLDGSPNLPLPALGVSSSGFNAALVDGSVRPVSKMAKEADIRAAITPAGGESLSDFWERGTQRRTSVSGRVTLAGQPLQYGLIAFHPEAGRETISQVNNGTYRLPEIASGSFRVTLSATTKMAKGEVQVERIPQRYTSVQDTPLRTELASGSDNTYDIELAP